VDNAGNIESAHMLTVNIDSTLPSIVPSVSGTLGANGWYVSNVTVSWTVTDPYSGIASSSGCGPVTLTSYTTGTTLSCSAASVAGLTNSGSVIVKIDEARVQTLDPSAANSFVANTNTTVTANGEIVVDSNSSKALAVLGNGKVTATAVSVTGGVSAPAGAISPLPKTGVSPRLDPFSSLAAPTYSGCNFTNYIMITGSETLAPGVYCGGITILGGKATFNPGLYIINGGGLSILAGSATGQGVTFYVTSNGHPYGPVSIDIDQVILSAPTSGPLAGVLFFQDRSVKSSLPNSLLNNGSSQLNGLLYFPTTAVLYSGGSASSPGPTIIVADTVNFSGTCNLR
jgi:hypothetical protein